MSSPETTKKLIYSILQFLQASLDNGTVRADDKEGVEVAVQCIGEAFDVSPTDTSLSTGTPLLDIFSSHLSGPAPASSTSSTSKPTSAPTSSKPSAADIADAERLKAQGNSSMSSKNYAGAIDFYTQALALNPQNPVYYSNRAAAYSSLGEHERAAEDAESALGVDSTFAKAYSRLGHARYSLKQYSLAADAFRKGLQLDPGNGNMKSGLENAEQRLAEEPPEYTADAEEEDPRVAAATSPAAGAGAGGAGGFDFSRAAEMLQGMGGGRGAGAGAGAPGGGGMPDLAGLMNNPQIMQAAQQMMQNGGLEQLMNNPMMRNLAQQFMGGQGRGAGAP